MCMGFKCNSVIASSANIALSSYPNSSATANGIFTQVLYTIYANSEVLNLV